jgi:hypothetical protein
VVDYHARLERSTKGIKYNGSVVDGATHEKYFGVDVNSRGYLGDGVKGFLGGLNLWGYQFQWLIDFMLLHEILVTSFY